MDLFAQQFVCPAGRMNSKKLFRQGLTSTTNESMLSAAFAVTSQQPSVGKYKPEA